MSYQVLFKGSKKLLRSKNFNYAFDMKTGFMAQWGQNFDEDPEMCPFGPTIFDCEITTTCKGIGSQGPCKFCYKANGPKGENMSYETFEKIFYQLPDTLTQIAFGADASLTANPDLWRMMELCRRNNVIPNITCADISQETANLLAQYCGAVAVSFYGDERIFRKSLHYLKRAGIEQRNCHVLISKETMDWAHHLVDNWRSYEATPLDRAFIGYNELLNAIVFLQLKQCKRGKGYTPVNQHEYNQLIEKCLDNGIPFGSDSCGCGAVAHAFEDLGKNPPMELLQPCESTCESFYCSSEGVYYPCSFNEFDQYGISYKDVSNFVEDVWYNDKTKVFRNKLLTNNRNCPTYKILG